MLVGPAFWSLFSFRCVALLCALSPFSTVEVSKREEVSARNAKVPWLEDGWGLFSNSKFLDQLAVTIQIIFLQVIE